MKAPRHLIVLIAWVGCFCLVPRSANATDLETALQATRANSVESPDPVPPQLQGVGVDEHLGAQIPLDLTFVNESGAPVQLTSLFADKLPVILTLNYSNCPMLCSLQLSGLTDSLKQIDFKLGEGYRVITISIDPAETPATAHRTQARYLHQYGHPERTAAWHFLTGSEQNIRALAGAVGFNYKYDANQKQYYHAASIAIASPRGQLMRYLYGVEYPPKTLRLGLLEASQGTIGTTVDKLILFCSAYNPKSGTYAAVASRIVTVGGLVILLVLAVFLLILWQRELRRRRRSHPMDGAEHAHGR